MTPQKPPDQPYGKLSRPIFMARLSPTRLTSQAILRMDKQCALSPNPDMYKERLRLQSEYDLLLTS